MKKYRNFSLITIFTVIVIKNIHGQLENALWLLADSIQIDFTANSPQSSRGIHKIPSRCENISVVCNSLGNLLFYTYGEEIWDRNHVLIEYGDDLGGNRSTTEGTLVVRSVRNRGLYHIFALENAGADDGSNLYYSILDISANNGQGEIVQAPVVVWDNLTEKMVGITRECGGVWIILHERNNNQFLSFLLEDDTLNSEPIVSKCGTAHSPRDMERPYLAWAGQMKASPSGQLIAVLSTEGLFEIVHFDRQSGFVADPITIYNLESGIGSTYYSGEFSGSGQFFYLSEYNERAKADEAFSIVQFDLSSQDIGAILDSRTRITHHKSPATFKLMQDQAIYIVNYTGYDALHRIASPDQRGESCQYQHDYLYVGKELLSNNLPQDLIIPLQKDWFALPSDTSFCGNNLNIDLSAVPASVQWSDGDTNAIKVIEKSGRYIVNAIDEDGCTYSDTISVQKIDEGISWVDTTLCPGDYLLVGGDTVSERGQYSEEINVGSDCEATRMINLDFFDINSDTTIVEILEGGAFEWEDSVFISPGLFSSIAKDENGCWVEKYILLEDRIGNVNIYVPNVFTPNQDGINDNLEIFAPDHLLQSLQIYNRWGGLIYTSRGPEFKWNGKGEKKRVNPGVYMYRVQLEDQRGKTIFKTGSVTVLR